MYNSTAPYHDRTEAAALLADQLTHYQGTNTIILAIPRGGVTIGFDLARILHLPLELALAKKIGHPSNPEYAIGAVSLDEVCIAEEVSPQYLEKEIKRLKAELQSRLQHFTDGRKGTPLEGKNVILVDDGIATGRTLIACVNSIRKKKPSRLVVAAPVASSHAAAVLRPLVDEFICPLVASEFHAVGQFYENFDQVSDEEVKSLLNRAAIDDRHQ